MLDFEVSNSKHTLLAFEESPNFLPSTWQMKHNRANTRYTWLVTEREEKQPEASVCMMCLFGMYGLLEMILNKCIKVNTTRRPIWHACYMALPNITIRTLFESEPSPDQSVYYLEYSFCGITGESYYFFKPVSNFHKFCRKTLRQRRGWIYIFCGQVPILALSWPHVLWVCLTSSQWAHCFFSVFSFFISWEALRLGFCIGITEGSKVVGKAWDCTPHAFLPIA